MFNIIAILFLLISITGYLYVKKGFFKSFYHDILEWCLPNENTEIWSDGVNTHAICKYCNREIIQDSQGNWF